MPLVVHINLNMRGVLKRRRWSKGLRAMDGKELMAFPAIIKRTLLVDRPINHTPSGTKYLLVSIIDLGVSALSELQWWGGSKQISKPPSFFADCAHPCVVSGSVGASGALHPYRNTSTLMLQDNKIRQNVPWGPTSILLRAPTPLSKLSEYLRKNVYRKNVYITAVWHIFCAIYKFCRIFWWTFFRFFSPPFHFLFRHLARPRR